MESLCCETVEKLSVNSKSTSAKDTDEVPEPINEHVFEYSTTEMENHRETVECATNVGLAPPGLPLFESVGDHVLGINYMSLINGHVKVHSGASSDSPTCKTMP